MTVVVAQTANAFACRSSSRTPRALGLTTNRLLLPAASIGVGFSLLVVLVAPIAAQLDHAAPSAALRSLIEAPRRGLAIEMAPDNHRVVAEDVMAAACRLEVLLEALEDRDARRNQHEIAS